MDYPFDAIVVGAGGAGLWAALELAREGVNTAVLTKLYPTRSHTGTAQGGVCAALGNLEEDKPEWHMFDTIKGGDYLVDQDAAEVLANEAIETVIELEHMGLPFNRTPEGKIDQRKFGGHTRNFGEAPVRRACFAADRTGHMILQTLYQQCIKHGVKFLEEYQVVDLLFDGGEPGKGGRAAGVVAYRVADGQLHRFRTWSSSSSTRRGSLVSAFSCRRRPAAKAARSSTTWESALWSATRPSSWSWRRGTWSAGRCTRRSGPAAVSAARITCTWTCGTSAARSSRRSCPTSLSLPASTRAWSRSRSRFRFSRRLTTPWVVSLSLIHISEPTRLGMISYAVFCLKKKKKE